VGILYLSYARESNFESSETEHNQKMRAVNVNQWLILELLMVPQMNMMAPIHVGCRQGDGQLGY
jgi:hypothetical protein